MHVLLRVGSSTNWIVPVVIGVISEEDLRKTLEEVLEDSTEARYAESHLRRVGQWDNYLNTYYFAKLPQPLGS